MFEYYDQKNKLIREVNSVYLIIKNQDELYLDISDMIKKEAIDILIQKIEIYDSEDWTNATLS